MLRRLEVVERRDPNDLLAHSRGAGRPQLAAVRAAVADRRDDDHALVDEVVGGNGFRRLRPVVERCADAHVQHVRLVLQRHLHRGDHHVGVRRAVATEDAVGKQFRPWGDTDDLSGRLVAATAGTRKQDRGPGPPHQPLDDVGQHGVSPAVPALHGASVPGREKRRKRRRSHAQRPKVPYLWPRGPRRYGRDDQRTHRVRLHPFLRMR